MYTVGLKAFYTGVPCALVPMYINPLGPCYGKFTGLPPVLSPVTLPHLVQMRGVGLMFTRGKMLHRPPLTRCLFLLSFFI